MKLSTLLDELVNFENPFDSQGTDDPNQNQKQRPIVDVGLVSRATKQLVPVAAAVPQLCHALLIAPYGGGKSATLRRIKLKTIETKNPVAYIKLESASYKGALRALKDVPSTFAKVVLENFCEQIAKVLTKFDGKTGAEFDSTAESKKKEILSKLTGQPMSRTFSLIGDYLAKKKKTGIVLIDELESLLVDNSISNEIKVDILDIFKNWSETTKKGLFLVLAGTQPCLDFLRKEAPKLLGGRFRIFDSYALEPDEVADYIIEKCKVATNDHPLANKIFAEDAIDLITIASHGIPRRIEIICYGAWTTASVRLKKIDRETIREQLYNHGEGVLNPLMKEHDLTQVQQRVLRKLLKYGMSTVSTKGLLTANEKGVIRRICKKNYDIPFVERHGRGLYELSDQILVKMFSRNMT